MSESIFLRLLSHDNKATALAEAVAAVREGNTLNPIVHTVDSASFRQVPGSPFAYWVSERIRRLFTELPPFEGEGRTVKQGLATADDFRFVRTWWEVPVNALCPPTAHPVKQDGAYCVLSGYRWFPFAKGGAYSPYYADLHLVVNWERDGEEMRSFAGSVIRNPDFYFRPGLTWPRRTTSGISVRNLPAGSVFADKGPTAFVVEKPYWLGLLQSSSFETLISLQLSAADAAARTYDVGLIQRTPIPTFSDVNGKRIGQLAQTALDLKQSLDITCKTSHIFFMPALLQIQGESLANKLTALGTQLDIIKQQLAEYQREIDDIVFRLYGIDGDDRRAVEENLSRQQSSVIEEEAKTDSAEEETETETIADAKSFVADLLSYDVGCVLGRWDIRFATGEKPAPELPDPFAPLPVCSPGMLQGEDGLPLREAPPNYPLRIDWDGILVDDLNHQDDIVRRVRDVLELLWKDRAEAIEKEACEILGIKELRDYFRRPGNDGFWMTHVKRYSKSRRKAPIYWLLQSLKKNYALWLYYHRLDKDLLFKALVNYVEPKLRLEESNLEQIRSKRASAGTSGREAKQLEKQLERQEALLSELRDFHDKLSRAANLHLEPDLNDGVILNIAPLWELVPWNEAKKYWEELLAGKYEWSSISKQLRRREHQK